MNTSPYDLGLERNPANYVPLSPLSFLPRTATVYPDRTAIVHGSHRTTWREPYVRCRLLASALARHGVSRGDTVAVLAPNVPAAFEAHFGVPMLGAVLKRFGWRATMIFGILGRFGGGYVAGVYLVLFALLIAIGAIRNRLMKGYSPEFLRNAAS